MKPEWMPENPYPKWFNYQGDRRTDSEHRCFQEGCQQTVRKIVKWFFGQCTEHCCNARDIPRWDCPDCVKQLKKEVGIDGD